MLPAGAGHRDAVQARSYLRGFSVTCPTGTYQLFSRGGTTHLTEATTTGTQRRTPEGPAPVQLTLPPDRWRRAGIRSSTYQPGSTRDVRDQKLAEHRDPHRIATAVCLAVSGGVLRTPSSYLQATA